jgi:hypothetical protein
MAFRRGALLLVAGLVSETVYLVVVVRLPWWRYGHSLHSWSQLLGRDLGMLAVCLAGVGVLAAAYLWGWQLVRKGRGARWIVWGFAALYALTLLWLMPITSDVFAYLGHAHLFTDLGLNPLQISPRDVAGDGLLQAYPTHYASYPSIYGPAWVLLSAPGTLGPHDVVGGLSYLKGLAAVAYLGCAWLLERLLRQRRPAAALEGLYCFAWNPLVLLMAVGDSHNDVVMMALVLLALWFLLREWWVAAFGALALSVWIKAVAAIYVPLFFIYALGARLTRLGTPSTGREGLTQAGSDISDGVLQERDCPHWMAAVAGGLALVGVSLLVLFPFWDPQLLPGMVGRLLRPANWQVGATALSARGLVLGLLLFALVYLVLAWRFVRRRRSFGRLASASFCVSLLAFLLGAARSQPWHLIWPAALAGLSDRRWAPAVVAGLSFVMLAAQLWVEWGAPGAAALF